MANKVNKPFNMSRHVSDRSGVVVFTRKDGKYYCCDSFHEALKEIFNTRATVEYIDLDNNYKSVRVDASIDADKKVITLHIPAEFGSNDKALRLMYTIEGEITAEEVAVGGGSSGGGIMYVNFTWRDDTLTADKTFAEIGNAFESGIYIIGKMDNSFLPLTVFAEGYAAQFASAQSPSIPATQEFAVNVIAYKSDGEISSAYIVCEGYFDD